jgi:hypothetical protein
MPSSIRTALVVAMVVAAIGLISCGGDGPAGRRAAAAAPDGGTCDGVTVSAVVWRAASFSEQGDDGVTPRQKLADRLVKCRTLIGKSYESVMMMLGPPDDGEARYGSIGYILGPERGIPSMDDELLELDLDHDLRVTDTMVGG